MAARAKLNPTPCTATAISSMTRASRPPPAAPSPPPPAVDAWQATRAQTSLATQFLGDPAENPDDPARDPGRQIGQAISATERELFVSCDPAEALQQQFEHLRPEFIAVHDIATASSRKLLVGVAAAIGTALQRLVIRRQGYGTPLCTLEFIELATADGGSIRMYTTQAEADTKSRHALAHQLLAHSRLGVVMVGDLPARGIAAAFEPLHQAMLAGPWPNRNLLLLPLASANAVAAHGIELTRGSGVGVRTTPQVSRPADAWAFINGTWGRLREQMRGQASEAGPVVPALAEFSAAPMPLSMRPMPPMPNAAVQAAVAGNPQDLLGQYVKQLGDLAGMVSCCVFDVAKRREIAHAGASPGPALLASQGAEMLLALSSASRTLGLGHALPEVAITLGAHHVLLRAVPKHPGLALHAVLDKAQANLTLVRLQVQRMDALFD